MTRSVLRKECFGSVKVFWLDRELALSTAMEGCRRLVRERKEVLRAGVFGSIARGDAVPGSDLDVLVVVENAADVEPRPFDRAGPYLPFFEEIDLPVEVFCFREQEAAKSAFFARNAPHARWAERTKG